MSPEQVRAFSKKPAALRRKIVEVNNKLAVMWSGDHAQARIFAQRCLDWFKRKEATDEEIEDFLHAYYQEPIKNFSAIIVQSDGARCYMIGRVLHSSTAFLGDYAVAGSGIEIFRSSAARMEPSKDEEVVPDIDGLRVANDLLAQEIVTGEPLSSGFGAAYEILYRGEEGFERVDNVLHTFALARAQNSDVEILHYQHALLQWYEGNQLCVGSLVTPETAKQALEFQPFAISGVLDEPKAPLRCIETFLRGPDYLCAHHLFEIAGRLTPSSLIMRGNAIGELFAISRNFSELQFEPTQKYREMLRERAAAIAQQRPGE